MFAIAGVSGHTGAVVAETLLAAGQPVRVVVRDAARAAPWAARGAEVAVADLGDAAALTRALAGVRGAYLLVPPRLASTDPLGDNRAVTAALATAVRAAAVPHVVLLSSVGAHHASGTGPIVSVHHAEQELGATGAALTAVRAAYFQDNWGASLGLLGQGVLPTFLPADLAFPQVATADIGKVAAQALVEGGRGRQVIELTGPRSWSARDVAAALSTITGRTIVAQEAPLDAVVPTFTQFGISAAMAGLYREMYQGIIDGRVVMEGGAARAVAGSVAVDATLRRLLAPAS
ncbi:MAG: NmrA family NAD(P)-binding protein [Kofleriaceae bacterium]|nr:NmrA family NAD(P)-binding protein [Kofleriaceae bacterium]